MPINLQPTSLKYKNGNSYESADCIKGEGLPEGGTTGQIVKKKSNTDYDYEWGSETVNDVQIDGTSILNNGVANVPMATASSSGVVAASNGNYGVIIGTNGNLKGVLLTYEAVHSDAKTGLNHYKPIVAAIQHESTFYGLAKAAGDSTQSASSNAVGTYTDAAKVAIQKMLGIRPVGDFEEIARYSVTENSDMVIVNTDLNGNTFKLANAMICIKLGTPTTGTNDYVSSGFFDENGTYRVMPTLRWLRDVLSNTWLVFQFNSFNGMPVVHGKASAAGNTQASQMATYNSTSGRTSFDKIDCMTGVRFSKYGTNTSLIPAGSEIIIYGCRLYD